jgi:hypothetical protein
MRSTDERRSRSNTPRPLGVSSRLLRARDALDLLRRPDGRHRVEVRISRGAHRTEALRSITRGECSISVLPVLRRSNRYYT